MMSSRWLLILALAIVSGLAAGYSALRYLNDRSSQVAPALGGDQEGLPVVLAARALPLGKVLEEADLRVVGWPGGAVPAGFATSMEEVVGRSLVTDVQANEVILEGKLAERGLVGLIPLIPPGMRALSVRVDEVVGVAGFVTPKTRVDVILIMSPPGSPEVVSKVILQNIQALAAGQEIRQTEDGSPITVTVVTVLVTPEEAERLALASSEGRIQMALRNTLDLESVETPGERTSRLFAGGIAAPTGNRTVVRSAPAVEPTETQVEMYRGIAKSTVKY